MSSQPRLALDLDAMAAACEEHGLIGDEPFSALLRFAALAVRGSGGAPEVVKHVRALLTSAVVKKASKYGGDIGVWIAVALCDVELELDRGERWNAEDELAFWERAPGAQLDPEEEAALEQAATLPVLVAAASDKTLLAERLFELGRRVLARETDVRKEAKP